MSYGGQSLRPLILSYFTVFGVVAFFIAFLPLHCKRLGFDPFTVSLVMASGNLSALCGAPFFMRFIPRYLTLHTSVRLCALATILMILLFFAATTMYPFLICVFLMMFFINGLLVQFDAHALHSSIGGAFRFEHIRIWGSFGFIVFSFAFGIAIDWLGDGSILWVGLAVALAALIPTELLARSWRDQKTLSHESNRGSLNKSSLLPGNITFVFVVALCWASHAALYVFLSLYLQALQWSATMISLAWALSVAAEMAMFMKFHLLERRFQFLSIIKLSLVLTVLRWAVLAISSHAAAILISQALHAFSFASFHVACMKYIYNLLPPEERVSGQAVLVTLGGGSGSLIGRVGMGCLAGQAMSITEFQSLFLISAVLAGSALVASLSLAKDVRPTPQ